MLVRFRFGNFRCFKDDQELSLVAAKKSETTIAVERPQLDLLRAAAIFGANASGKSSVLGALSFMKSAVRWSFQMWEPVEPLPVELHALKSDEPGAFEILFLAGEVLYEYAFRLDRTRVLTESLHASEGRRYLLFERSVGPGGLENYVFGRKLKGRNRTIEELTRPNCLFLSTAAAYGHQELGEVYRWFVEKLQFANLQGRLDQATFTTQQIETNSAFRGQVLRMLQRADFGIRRLEFRPLESEVSHGGTRKRTEQTEELVFVHTEQDREFELGIAAESVGTQAWFALTGPILWCLENGSTLCVDELDSSLHPLLVREIIRMFEDPERNPSNAQLIFNSHDSTLLGNVPDPAPLSRDEVWFTERLPEGGSKLYPLSDFETKKDDNLERRYLFGRYGALPLLRLDEQG